jgi:CDP-glycerol glycerophosphotransferase (TagB/SpsB family)
MVRRFAWQCPDFVDGQDSQLARALRRHAGYSKVLVASSLLQESYRHAFRIARSRIEVLPLPRVDALRNPDMNRIDFLMAENAELFSFALRVVYAPAPHEVSLAQEVQKERLEALVRAAKNHDALLMVKDKSLEALQEGDDSLQVVDSPNLMLNPDFDDLDLLAMADHVISDYNDFIFEAAVAAKPLWFYFDEASDGIRAQGLNFDPQQYLPHLCFRDAAELMDALSSAPLPGAEQEELIAHFVQAPEKIGITSAKRIARLVLQSIQ